MRGRGRGVVDLLRAAPAFVPARWWRRPPFLPVPDRAYMRFRMETAYGDPGARPEPGDLAEFLRWVGTMRAYRRPIRQSPAKRR